MTTTSVVTRLWANYGDPAARPSVEAPSGTDSLLIALASFKFGRGQRRDSNVQPVH